MNNTSKFGESTSQARISARRELDALIPLQTKVNFTKTPQDRFLIRRATREWKHALALQMGMSLKTHLFKDVLKAYQKEHMQIIYLQ